MTALKTLILGGTTEAAMLARLLAHDPRFDAMLSLAGVTDAPVRPPIKLRIGGFGGAAGLAAHLRDDGVGALIDATHPFAGQISANAEVAANAAGVPRLVIARPAWTKRPGDMWTMVANGEAAADALGATARRVFVTVGRKDLAPFAARPWHHFVVRSVDPPGDAAPFGAEIILARGPFALEDETRLLETRRIEVIVTKNSGGTATYPKLQAANRLGIPVVMIERPAAPHGQTVLSAAAALQWLETLAQETLAQETLAQAALAPRGV